MKVAGLLVVSDESIPRIALRHWLSTVPGLEVLGDTTAKKAQHLALESGAQSLSSTSPTSHSRARDNCRDTKAATRGRNRRTAPETNPLLVKSTFSSGATAYLLLSSAPTDLISGIRAALNGRRLLDPGLSEGLLDALLGKRASATAPLSEREQQVLLLRSLGHSAKKLAQPLASAQIYRDVLPRIREKLNLRSRAEMVRYALENGTLSPKGQT